MATYKEILENLSNLKASGKDAHVNMNPEHVARMRWQNQFQTGVDIASSLMYKTFAIAVPKRASIIM